MAVVTLVLPFMCVDVSSETTSQILLLLLKLANGNGPQLRREALALVKWDAGELQSLPGGATGRTFGLKRNGEEGTAFE